MLLLTSTEKSLWKTHEIHKNKSPFKYFNYVPIGEKKLTNKKKIISKGLLKTRFNFDLLKIHNYHLVKVPQKHISHVIL
jgi:hypothetical protein